MNIASRGGVLAGVGGRPGDVAMAMPWDGAVSAPGRDRPTGWQPASLPWPSEGGMKRIGIVALTTSGRGRAQVLAEAWPHAQFLDAASLAEGLRAAWQTCEAVVAFAGTGDVVRVLAPLIADKRTDPALIVVDDAARNIVALLGGRAAEANALARDVAAVLEGVPVTAAADMAGPAGLDHLGLPVEGAVDAVALAMREGAEVRLESPVTWPLPALPPAIRPDAHNLWRVVLTDTVLPLEDGRTVILRPPSLVVGLEASRGVSADEVRTLVHRALDSAGLSRASVRCLATADTKSGEAGIVQAARELGVPLVTYPHSALIAGPVPGFRETGGRAIGTASVAEAAALLPDGAGQLVVPEATSGMVAVAIARHAPRGRLAVVGLGPGPRDLLTPRAITELRRASVVVGLDRHVAQVEDLLRPGTRVLATRLGHEEEQVRAAVGEARAGHAVALIGSGDMGVHAMASPVIEEADATIDVVGVPGITAGLAASVLLGAPLGYDHVCLSLSGLRTPWPVIHRRLHAAAEGDLVVLLYNPRSRARPWQLAAALATLGGGRPKGTPAGIVRNIGRPDESVLLTTLEDLDPETVDMRSVVVVGNSTTYVAAGRMVTPRGYLRGHTLPPPCQCPDLT